MNKQDGLVNPNSLRTRFRTQAFNWLNYRNGFGLSRHFLSIIDKKIFERKTMF